MMLVAHPNHESICSHTQFRIIDRLVDGLVLFRPSILTHSESHGCNAALYNL